MTAPTSTVAGKDDTLIRELMAEQETAMRAGDADALVARYAPGAVTFDLAPPLRHTGAEVHDATGLRGWFATFDGPVDFEIRDLSVTADGDVAFCHSLNRLSAKPNGQQEKFDLWFRATVCLRRIDGAWLVAHEHTSTPFYMEYSDGSFRAAIDLRP